MHKDIKQFWQSVGYKLETTPKDADGDTLKVGWWIYRPDTGYTLVGVEWRSGEKAYYLLGSNARYTEEQMLRLIKLKAFL
jgi:hypothetical protein